MGGCVGGGKARCALLLGLVALVAAGCEVDPRLVHLELLPPEALGCRPTEVTEVLLTPRGDFPFEASVRLDLSGGPTQIDRFPLATEAVSVTASGEVRSGDRTEPWTGGGVAVLDEGVSALSIPLLQLRRSCALSDVRARALPGSAVVVLDDGRLLMAGGVHPELGVLDTIVTIRPGDRLAEDSEMRLFVPRSEASATRLDDGLLLIAGGRTAVDAAPLPTFEVFRVSGEGRAPDDGFLAEARAGHGAARLPDGRVLLVGGQGSRGPLASAELLSVVPGEVTSEVVATPTAGSLAFARAAPFVTVLDDGTVLVAGGGVPEIERYDPEADRFEVVGAFSSSRPGEAFASLIGARLARVGGELSPGWSREIEVALDSGREVLSLGDALETPIIAPVARDAGDGRLLVLGGHETLGRAAVLVDPGGTRTANERALEPLTPSRVATRLLPFPDGSFAELDADGVSLLRVDVTTPLDRYGANIFPVQTSNSDELSLDVAAHWRADGPVLVSSTDRARFDLPRARFRDVDVELEVRAPVELLLVEDGAPPRTIGVGVEGDCSVEVGAGLGVVRVQRRGGVVSIEHAGSTSTCTLELPPRIGIAVRADRGGGVRFFSFDRR